MRPSMNFILPLLLLVCSCTPQQPEDPLLRSALIWHGGREAVVNSTVVHAKGRISALFLGEEGTYEYWFQREGRRLRVETRYARHSETRVLEGSRGFRGQGGEPLSEVTGFRYEAMLYQLKHIDILFGLLSGAYRVEGMGEAFTPAGRSGEGLWVEGRGGAAHHALSRSRRR